MIRSLLRAAALAVVLPLTVQAQIVNGSFEGCGAGNYIGSAGDASINGWTMTRQGVEWFSGPTFGITPRNGNCVVDLAWFTSNGVPGGGIKQTISTLLGQQYKLSYWGATAAFAGRNGTGVIELWLNGSLYSSNNVFSAGSTVSLGDWTQFTDIFTATGTTTDIEFRNQQDAFTHFADLDDVSISMVSSTVPEPGSFFLLGSGLAGLATVLRRRG